MTTITIIIVVSVVWALLVAMPLNSSDGRRVGMRAVTNRNIAKNTTSPILGICLVIVSLIAIGIF